MKTTILLTMAMFIALLPARSDARENAGNDETAKPKQREQGKKESAAGKKVRLMGMHAQMVKVCNLNEDQQKQIAELNDLRQKAMKEFETANAEKIKTLKAQVAEAKKKKDKEAIEETGNQLKELRLEWKQIDSQWQAKIMAVLTPEQKAQWDQYQARLLINKQFKKAKLTDEQAAEVKVAYAKFMTDVDLSDKEARREAVQKLTDHIKAEILTDAQRAATTRPAKTTTTKPAEKSEKPSETGGEEE